MWNRYLRMMRGATVWFTSLKPINLRKNLCSGIVNVYNKNCKGLSINKHRERKGETNEEVVTVASMNDVAAHAGVSNATVSRVLSDKPHVSEEVRARVYRAVEALGYQPDTTARRLRSQTTSQVIGLIVSDIQNPHFAALVRGVEDVAFEHRMNVILCNTDEQGAREAFYIKLMQSERAAGLLINPIGEEAPGLLSQVQALGTALVFLDNSVADLPFDSIGVDDREGAAAAVQHLMNLGYRRVGMVGGRMSQSTGRRRFEGYCDALLNKLELDTDLVIETDFSEAGGYGATRKLLQHSAPPDALFCANNSATLGALRAARELGVRIPHDLALVSFDDVPWGAFLDPPLTAVAQPSYDIGVQAARLLKERLEDKTRPPRNLELPTRLIVRESCGSRLAK